MSALDHPLTWAAPRPLWRAAGQPGLQPAILRFAQDDFADQLLGAMASDPASIAAFVARYETWRTPPGETRTPDLAARVPLPEPVKRNRRSVLRRASPPAVPAAKAQSPTLKLYQPAHQRHYIATATLACAVSGLPDRKLSGGHEKVGMLLRRLIPSGETGELAEYAWITSAAPRWQRVSQTDPAVLAPGEEMLPVFPIAHREDERIARRSWGGSIPVGKREDYLAAPLVHEAVSLAEGQKAELGPPRPEPLQNSKQARLSEFRIDVAEPWKATIRTIFKEASDLSDAEGDAEDKQTALRLRNYQLQMQSWLMLLDFRQFLDRHLHKVAARLHSGSAAGLSTAEVNLLTWLRGTPAQTSIISGMGSTGKVHAATLADALHRIAQSGVATKLEAIETEYIPGLEAEAAAMWPGFHYLLAGIGSNGAGGAIALDGPFNHDAGAPDADDTMQILGPGGGLLSDANEAAAKVDRLTVLIGRALPVSQEETARPKPFAERLSKVMVETADDPGLFCIRFCHLNADCGPLHPPTLSLPTETFSMASFFDPDAPAREIKIMLPRDTSAAGLRKHARGTAFVMSDMLCGQVQRAKSLGLIDLIRQVLPWPLHKDIDLGQGGGCKNASGADIGMICSLSIPIITLCALILLMIIVTLLDFLFKWVPWLIACFPLPGFKAKGGPS